MSEVSKIESYVRFMREAARYFENRPCGGEDRAHWSNVFNADTCRKIAEVLNERNDLHQWQPIETAPNDVYHARGLWVHAANGGKRLYWETICGHIDDVGEFVDHDGNSPWRADDYSRWMPITPPETD